MQRYQRRHELRRAILAKGARVADAAMTAGISHAHLAGIIAGRQNPSRTVAVALGRFVDRPLEEIFVGLFEPDRTRERTT